MATGRKTPRAGVKKRAGRPKASGAVGARPAARAKAPRARAEKRGARPKAPGAGAKNRAAGPAAPSSEREQLVARIAAALRVSHGEAELRALRELAERVAPQPPPDGPRVHVPPSERRDAPPGPALPQRLFLLLDGRGIDGRGLPVEVIDLPTVVGSGRSCTLWVNSPQIETRHLQITREGNGWMLEDLGSEKGTFLAGERIHRRRIEHGDEYHLAGYLRLRTELR